MKAAAPAPPRRARSAFLPAFGAIRAGPGASGATGETEGTLCRTGQLLAIPKGGNSFARLLFCKTRPPEPGPGPCLNRPGEPPPPGPPATRTRGAGATSESSDRLAGGGGGVRVCASASRPRPAGERPGPESGLRQPPGRPDSVRRGREEPCRDSGRTRSLPASSSSWKDRRHGGQPGPESPPSRSARA